MKNEEIEIRHIRIDGGTQTRAGLSSSTLAEYVALLADSDGTWPFRDPIELVYDGSEYWLADGFHRVAACKQLGRFVAIANVQQGTQRDAILYSVGANADHGLRRSHDDKRRAVQRLLEDDEWNKWSDREIARRCKVSAPLVGKMRSELTVNIYSDQPAERTYVRNGKVSTMDTSGIGRASDYGNPDKWDDDIRQAKIKSPIERAIRQSHNDWYRSGVFADVLEQGADHPDWDSIEFPDWARPSEIQTALQALADTWPRVIDADEPKPIPSKKVTVTELGNMIPTRKEKQDELNQAAVDWLRNYTDEHNRIWNDLTDNQTHHANAPCYQAFVKAYPDGPDHKFALKQARAVLKRELENQQADEKIAAALAVNEAYNDTLAACRRSQFLQTKTISV